MLLIHGKKIQRSDFDEFEFDQKKHPKTKAQSC